MCSTVGTSRLRRLILRSEYSSHFKTQMGTAIALVGRLVDIAANFQRALSERNGAIDAADRQRCLCLSDEVKILCQNLMQQQLPAEIKQPLQEVPSRLPFLPTMEGTVALIPKAFSGSGSIDEFIPAPLDEEGPTPIFVADAFSNRSHVYFALRGTLAPSSVIGYDGKSRSMTEFDPSSASGKKWLEKMANKQVTTGTKCHHISNNAPRDICKLALRWPRNGWMARR
jgi:hypothetical protein